MEILTFIKDNLTVILTIVGGIILWRSGFLGQLVSSSKQLLDLKQQELNNALAEIVQLKAENKLLRNDILFRGEISEDDKAEIKELKAKIRELEGK